MNPDLAAFALYQRVIDRTIQAVQADGLLPSDQLSNIQSAWIERIIQDNLADNEMNPENPTSLYSKRKHAWKRASEHVTANTDHTYQTTTPAYRKLPLPASRAGPIQVENSHVLADHQQDGMSSMSLTTIPIRVSTYGDPKQVIPLNAVWHPTWDVPRSQQQQGERNPSVPSQSSSSSSRRIPPPCPSPFPLNNRIAITHLLAAAPTAMASESHSVPDDDDYTGTMGDHAQTSHMESHYGTKTPPVIRKARRDVYHPTPSFLATGDGGGRTQPTESPIQPTMQTTEDEDATLGLNPTSLMGDDQDSMGGDEQQDQATGADADGHQEEDDFDPLHIVFDDDDDDDDGDDDIENDDLEHVTQKTSKRAPSDIISTSALSNSDEFQLLSQSYQRQHELAATAMAQTTSSTSREQQKTFWRAPRDRSRRRLFLLSPSDLHRVQTDPDLLLPHAIPGMDPERDNLDNPTLCSDDDDDDPINSPYYDLVDRIKQDISAQRTASHPDVPPDGSGPAKTTALTALPPSPRRESLLYYPYHNHYMASLGSTGWVGMSTIQRQKTQHRSEQWQIRWNLLFCRVGHLDLLFHAVDSTLHWRS